MSVRRSSPKRSEISDSSSLMTARTRDLVAEDRPQLGDPLADVRVLLGDGVGLERRQLGEAQIENRGRLDRGQLEALDRAVHARLRDRAKP